MPLTPQDMKDPLKLAKLLWPDLMVYDKQKEIVESVLRDKETYVPAGNQLGKDFIAGLICLCYFLTRHPCRIVTTSVKDDHLRVLWGEIGRLIDTSRFPLRYEEGGPLLVNHQDIRKVINLDTGLTCKISYLTGIVSKPPDMTAMAGHHATYNLLVADEASGLDDAVYEKGQGWMKRLLVIGNPHDCHNFFRRGVEGGDMPDPDNPGRFFKKVIQISAYDSPNVRYAQKEIARGKKPSGKILLPGVLSWDELRTRLATWDEIRKCVGIDGQFYKGAGLYLYPSENLNRAEEIARSVSGKYRQGRAIGIDPAEGGDKTAMVCIDDMGIIELVSKKTPDTDSICGEAIAFMQRHSVPPDKIAIDRGGGGKQLADRMRAQGYQVRTIAFGEAMLLPPKRPKKQFTERFEVYEEKSAYKNRRAQMYWELADLLDPSLNPRGFGIPAEYDEIRRQLSYIRKEYNEEGVKILPPKNRRDPDAEQTNRKTLTELIGHSPDEADALVLAVHAMLHKPSTTRAGAVA